MFDEDGGVRYVPRGHTWAPMSVPGVVERLRGVRRWWLSCGRAIDEYVGRTTRKHGDTDVTVAREDWRAVDPLLRPTMEIWTAHDGQLDRTHSSDLPSHIANLWLRERGHASWRLQVKLEPIQGDVWHYARDARVSRPLDEATRSSGRVWCVSPAVQLLWKSKAPQAKDEHDYSLVVPELPSTERAWLAEAIALAHPDSPWASRQ